jgi:hypothetical protein
VLELEIQAVQEVGSVCGTKSLVVSLAANNRRSGDVLELGVLRG